MSSNWYYDLAKVRHGIFNERPMYSVSFSIILIFKSMRLRIFIIIIVFLLKYNVGLDKIKFVQF